MKRLVVVSGASGIGGNETVRRLIKRDYYVIGFDNFFASSISSLSDIINHPKFSFFEYDLCNLNQMAKLNEYIISLMTQQEIFDLSFINYAAIVHTKYFYDPESTFTTNVVGMKNFLKMAIELNAKTFINCSSSEVYSLNSYKPGGVKENDPLLFVTAEVSQRTSYAAGKLMTEFFLMEVVKKGLINGCSIRFANVYSNNELMAEHIIPYIINALSHSNNIQLLENARYTYRSFIHNYDSSSAVISLLETESALDGSIYNVGTQEEVLITDLVKTIGQKMGHQNVTITYVGERTADPNRRLLNTDKIFRATGWTPKVKLCDGIDMCLRGKC